MAKRTIRSETLYFYLHSVACEFGAHPELGDEYQALAARTLQTSGKVQPGARGADVAEIAATGHALTNALIELSVADKLSAIPTLYTALLAARAACLAIAEVATERYPHAVATFDAATHAREVLART